MTDRETLARAFLDLTPWAASERAPLAGDASNRRYERLTNTSTGQTYVFMDAPPDGTEGVLVFERIANYLRDQGLSAPEIYCRDAENGFMLIEDLGDDLFARVIERNPDLEMPLYKAATDVLVALHQAPVPELEPLGPRIMAEMVDIAFDYYGQDVDPGVRARFTDRFEDILRNTITGDVVLVQRDYHAENLLWLPERDGVARVGLLDFQGARAGHCAYDLVSLLQDARRDVPVGVEMQMIDRYIRQSGVDDSSFRAAYTVLGVQRNLRILGVFARLGKELGKPHYVPLIPRVWNHVRRGLDHPALAPVSEMIRESLPNPTDETLRRFTN